MIFFFFILPRSEKELRENLHIIDIGIGHGRGGISKSFREVHHPRERGRRERGRRERGRRERGKRERERAMDSNSTSLSFPINYPSHESIHEPFIQFTTINWLLFVDAVSFHFSFMHSCIRVYGRVRFF